jgi:DNA-binding LacI/PurR family transcriptional regulator
MKPTIKDVAKLAGVSIKTVSNVINNNKGRYKEETRQRVLAAMAELNYQPNRAARYMRSGQIGIIALTIPDISNPYFAEIAREVIKAARSYDHTVLIDHTDGLPEQERLVVQGLRPHAVDGIILDPLTLTEDDLNPEKVVTPIVLLGERMTNNKYYDHVQIDNVGAARLAVLHLIELGRRRIAIMPVPKDEKDVMSQLRYRGYLDALQQAGIPVDPSLTVYTSIASFTYYDGEKCMNQLLSLPKPPDAVLCLNDRVALGAMKTLRLRGYQIPGEVAVVGFDNIEEGSFAAPSLTTIAPDKEEIAKTAVSLLINRILGKRKGPPELIQTPFRLIVRESTIGVIGASGGNI